MATGGAGGGGGEGEVDVGGDVGVADGVEGVFVGLVLAVAAERAGGAFGEVVVGGGEAVVDEEEGAVGDGVGGETDLAGDGGGDFGFVAVGEVVAEGGEAGIGGAVEERGIGPAESAVRC